MRTRGAQQDGGATRSRGVGKREAGALQEVVQQLTINQRKRGVQQETVAQQEAEAAVGRGGGTM